MKKITLYDFLTDEQVDMAVAMYPDRKRIRDHIIEPNMKRINERIGQENDPNYISYIVVHIISEVNRKTIN
jgi:hypothetical protein